MEEIENVPSVGGSILAMEDSEKPRQRQYHHKSRKGCLKCKERRVKCCETRPVCEACNRLDLDCTWLSRSNHDDESQPSAAESSTSSLQSKTLAIDQIELLHHWILHTASTLSHTPAHLRIYSEVAVNLGFKHTYLLNGILAFAAIHKATLSEGTDRHRYTRLGIEFMDRSLGELRPNLPQINDDNCEPAVLLAIIELVYHLALIQLQEPPDWIAYLVEFIHFTQCIASWIVPVRAALVTGDLGASLEDKNPTDLEEVWTTSPHLESLQQAVNDLPTRDVQELAEKTCCEITLRTLRKVRYYARVYATRRTDHIAAVVMHWPVMCPPSFTYLLVRRRAVALASLAEWLGVLEYCRSYWWLNDGLPRMQAAVNEIRMNQVVM